MAVPNARRAQGAALVLPPGVTLAPLETHADARGELTEVHRASWYPGHRLDQWTLVRATGNSLRGVHVHRTHRDAVVVIAGEMILGLQDIRSGGVDDGAAVMLRLSFDDPCVVIIPPGVAHGFFFAEPASVLVGISGEYYPTDDVACHWADPALRMNWPARDPVLSARDRDAGSLAEMILALRA